MKFTKLATSIGLTIGSVLFVSNSAHALGFTTNIEDYSSVAEKGSQEYKDYSEAQKNEIKKRAKEDFILESITQTDSNGIDQTFSNFVFVDDDVRVWNNDKWTRGNEGAASTDAGDNTAFAKNKETREDPTAN
ncbi:MAG: hypothetical protein AAFR37_15945, partial [Cyanobacteria bacterium J06628_3]